MLDELAARFDDLEESRKALLQDLGARTPEQLSFQPEPTAWSMRQVAEHLWKVESAFLKAAQPPGAAGRLSLRNRLLRPVLWVIFRLGIRVQAPTRRVLPTESLDLAEIETRWQSTREDFRAFLEAIAPDQLSMARFEHPIAGPLTPVELLAFLSDHFAHHHRQLRRIAAAPGFPA
ncbi:MAG: DinB family protein [Acidobacteria bacterium]|nr:DinB family protein [Acidobacteriota bacterium]